MDSSTMMGMPPIATSRMGPPKQAANETDGLNLMAILAELANRAEAICDGAKRAEMAIAGGNTAEGQPTTCGAAPVTALEWCGLVALRLFEAERSLHRLNRHL